MLVGCLGTLLALIALIIKPIIKLNTSINNLNALIDVLKTGQNSLEKRIDKHDEEIKSNHDNIIKLLSKKEEKS